MAKVKDVCLAYGNTLLKLGETEPNLFVLDADVSAASKTAIFGRRYPGRFINVGVAEQNMVSIAAGLALLGFRPVMTSLARFISTRALDQIITSVAYPRLDVKIVGFYAGLSIGRDGASHQALEDIAIMRSIPGMTIVCPGSLREVEELITQSVGDHGPFYFRLSEGLSLNSYPKRGIRLGRGERICEGARLTVVTTGLMTGLAFKAIVSMGRQADVDLIHLHTLKPVDEAIITESARKTGNVLTIEDHNVIGGLGSIVCDALAGLPEVRVRKVGVPDSFGMSGSLDELLEAFQLSSESLREIISETLWGGMTEEAAKGMRACRG